MAARELIEHVRLAFAKARRKLAAARRELAAGDYSLFSTLDEGDAREAVAQAERLLEAMAAHVRSRGLEPGTD